MSDLSPSAVTYSQLAPRREAELREAAQELEAAFLAEMLRHGGLGAPGKTLVAVMARISFPRSCALNRRANWRRVAVSALPSRSSMRWLPAKS